MKQTQRIIISGGGSGGSVYLTSESGAATFTGSGSITVHGGDGGDDTGGSLDGARDEPHSVRGAERPSPQGPGQPSYVDQGDQL